MNNFSGVEVDFVSKTFYLLQSRFLSNLNNFLYSYFSRRSRLSDRMTISGVPEKPFIYNNGHDYIFLFLVLYPKVLGICAIRDGRRLQPEFAEFIYRKKILLKNTKDSLAIILLHAQLAECSFGYREIQKILL